MIEGPVNRASRYVALLRGINVGGNRPIAMADLRACFEGLGFSDVTTYIQSGNVVFSSTIDRGQLIDRIEVALSATFAYPARVVVRSREDLQNVVDQRPEGFGDDPTSYRYDVLFLKEPLSVVVAMEGIPRTEGVDQVHAGEGVVYSRRLISEATRSGLNKLVSLKIYQSMTIRNWRTTTRLLEMMNVE